MQAYLMHCHIEGGRQKKSNILITTVWTFYSLDLKDSAEIKLCHLIFHWTLVVQADCFTQV